MPSLTAIGPGPNGTTHVKDETGRDIFLTPGNAKALEANGSLAPAGGGATVGLASPWAVGTAPSGTPSAGMSLSSPWTPGPAQPPPPSGGPQLPPALPANVASSGAPAPSIYASNERKRDVGKLAQQFGSEKEAPASGGTRSLTPVPAPQRNTGNSGTGVPTPQYEMVRTPGRKAGWVDHSRSSAGIAEDQQQDLLDGNYEMLLSQQKTAKERAELERVDMENQRVKAMNDGYKAKAEADRWGYLASKKDEYIQSKASELEQKNKELAGSSVDRGRYWKDRGWVGSLLSALSVGAYELGRAKGGNQGPNLVTEMINRGIDRDIDNQVANLTKRRNDLNAQQDNFDRHIANSSEEAKLEQKAAMQLAAANELRAQTLEQGLHYLQNDAETAAQGLEKEAFATQAKIMGMRTQQANQLYDRGSAGGWTIRETLPSQLETKRLEGGAKNAENLRKITGETPGGATNIKDPMGNVIGRGATNEGSAKLNERIPAYEEAKYLKDEMVKIIKEHENDSSFGLRDSEAAARYKSLGVRLKNALWSATRSDAPSENEAAQFEQAMGGIDLANWRTGQQRAVLEGVIEDGANTLSTRLRQGGADPSYLRTTPVGPTYEGQSR